jgi:hypothetical protein
MNNVSSVVESQIKALSTNFSNLMNQASQIYKNYNSTNAVTLVTGLGSSTTPATVSTALTQYQFESGITFCAQLGNFFNNASISSADYLGICENLISGNTPASSPLSPGVESLGQQLYTLAQNCITYYQNSLSINKAYNSNGLSQSITGISGFDGSIQIPGSSTSAAEFTSGITLVVQFINLMTNQAVVTGDYFGTITTWTQD